MAEPYIPLKLFQFFRELEQNNNKNWFDAHKPDYEAHVREPLLEFIEDFGVRLLTFARNYVADARKSGGSLFRIYRDVRFSKDKTPYKTHAGIQFRHEQGKDVHAPGFYIHLAPDDVFCGLGLWHPEAKTAASVRQAIVDKSREWETIKNDALFNKYFVLMGESLKRPPHGFDADHPLLEDIKRKDFLASCALSEELACSPAFINEIEIRFKAGVPFMRFLCEAVGLPW